MANDEHVALLKQGVDAWNTWRDANANIVPNLNRAYLGGANLSGAKLSGANLMLADLSGANLDGAVLGGAMLSDAKLTSANLGWASFRGANLERARLNFADFTRAAPPPSWASLLQGSDHGRGEGRLHPLSVFRGADLGGANLRDADLSFANLSGAYLGGANLSMARLINAKLIEARLDGAIMVNTDLTGADLTGCRIYGVSAWNLKLEGAKQQSLVITDAGEPEITVDNIEVAQFIYLLLNNEKIRDVIDTIGKKGVLLLGRFTEGRIQILERLREKLRSLGFVPMVFNFDKPETKDFTETVRLLANLSKFVIVDITNPRSTPLELQAAVPDYMIPFAPILQEGEKPFAMFEGLQNKYDWVLQPVIGYPSVDRLIEVLEEKIVKPAEAKFNELLARRTKQLRVENV
jgi:uncharacterized protein YjbI with pentapeptide repeats